MAERTTVRVLAGRKSSGEPVHEELLVEPAVGDRWRAPASASAHVRHHLESLGGHLDSAALGLEVFTVPVRVGFGLVEDVMARLVREHPQVEWYYGNVYREDGVTPLGWWLT